MKWREEESQRGRDSAKDDRRREGSTKRRELTSAHDRGRRGEQSNGNEREEHVGRIENRQRVDVEGNTGRLLMRVS